MLTTERISIGPAVSQGPVERDLIGLLNSSPCGKSLGDARHRHARRGDHFCKIVRGGLPLDIRTESQDHFLGALLTEPLQQFADAQVLRTDPVKRRKLPSQGVVAPAENPGALQRKNVGGRLDDAEFAPFPCGIKAEFTLLMLRKESAKPAGSQRLACLADSASQLIGLGIWGAKHPKGDPLGAAGPDPRQAPQLLYQLAERLGIVERGHENDEG